MEYTYFLLLILEAFSYINKRKIIHYVFILFKNSFTFEIDLFVKKIFNSYLNLLVLLFILVLGRNKFKVSWRDLTLWISCLESSIYCKSYSFKVKVKVSWTNMYFLYFKRCNLLTEVMFFHVFFLKDVIYVRLDSM